MLLPISLPLTVAVVGTSIAVGLLVIFGLFLVRSRLDSVDRAARRVATIIAGSLVAWFLVAVWLAQAGIFRAAVDGPIPPMIAYGVTLPILIGTVLILRSPAFGRVLAAVPQHWLIGVQLYRTLGVIFLVSYGYGLLPGEFALPAGYGDILVGLTAIATAYLYAKKRLAARRVVIAWNALGIADLILAITLGSLTSPARFQMLSLDDPNVMITAYPLVMVPVFAVPLSILLHVCSLTKLSRDTRAPSESQGRTTTTEGPASPPYVPGTSVPPH